MKRAVLIASLLLILLASAAVGFKATETGVSVLLSVGDEKRSVEASIVFTDDTGTILTPSGGVLLIPENETIGVQVFPKNASGPTDFIIGYTMDTVMPKEPKRATYTDVYGWCFTLSPAETAQSPRYARALQLRITDRDAKKSWIRVIFKITYGSGWVTQYDQIVIKTVPRSQMAMAGGAGSGGDASAAVEGLKSNQAKTADYINQLESRVTNIENWIQAATSGGATTTASSSSSSEVTFPMRFIGDYVKLDMDIHRADGQVEKHTMMTHDLTLSLPKGENKVMLSADYGNVVKRKQPIRVLVTDQTKSVTINVGQGGR